MASNQSELLISVHKIDSEIIKRESKIQSITESIVKLEKKLKNNLSISKELEIKEAASLKAHNTEEQKYKEEEKKIMERRKQISSVGGNKSAKLAERELDIAKRIMESLEKNVLDSMQNLETLQSQKLLVTNAITELKELLESKSKVAKDQINILTSELNEYRKSKLEKSSKLDPRLSSLYKRVETRYRGDAVAFASGGACQTCFRSLPAQMFNQVMAGYNLTQCPGCSRILVNPASTDSEVTSPEGI